MQTRLFRRTLRILSGPFVLALLLSTAGCAGDQDATAAEEPEASTTAGTTETAAQPADTDTAPAADDTASPSPQPAAAAAPAKPTPKLTSLPGGTVAGGDLHEAYFYWDDQTLTVAGHPALFSKRGKWGRRVSLGAVAEPKAPQLVTCEMAAPPEGRLTPEDTLVLRGTFSHRDFAVLEGEPPKVVLKECELVSSGEPLPEGADPWSANGEPILAEDLHEAVYGWQGETVRVAGYYKGSTHSSANDTTSNALKAGVSGDTVVHCNQKGKHSAPEAVKADRASAVVEGTIGEPTWSQIVLTDCRWVGAS